MTNAKRRLIHSKCLSTAKVACIFTLSTSDVLMYSQTLLNRSLKGPKMWSHKTGGLLTQVNYSEKCIFEGLKGRSLYTGDLKDRFDCICCCVEVGTVQKKPVTTMLTYPWKCIVLHCNHLETTGADDLTL